MNVTFYSNFVKKRNSTLQPSGGVALDCKMKQSCSITTPTFLIDGIDLSYNYCQFNGRYYFINDITLNLNNIYEIECSIDVLATYKSQVAAYNGWVSRAASRWNSWILDNRLTSRQAIEEEVSVSTQFPFTSQGCFVFTVIGTGGLQLYACGTNAALGTLYSESAYPNASALTQIIQQFSYALVNVSDYLGAVLYVPISISDLGGIGPVNTITAGWWPVDVTGFDIYQIPTPVWSSGTRTLVIPQNYYTNDFRCRCDEYSEYSLYLPGVGTVPIRAIDVEYGPITISAHVDLYTGNIAYFLQHVEDGVLQGEVCQYNGQLGVPIPMGKVESPLGGAVMTIGSLVATAASGSAAGAAIAAGGEMASYDTKDVAKTTERQTRNNIRIADSMGNTITQGIKNALSPSVSIIGGGGNLALATSHPLVVLTLRCYATQDFPRITQGRPLEEYAVLGTLSGYIQCSGASVDIPGFAAEKVMVNNFLNSGFYME